MGRYSSAVDVLEALGTEPAASASALPRVWYVVRDILRALPQLQKRLSVHSFSVWNCYHDFLRGLMPFRNL